METFFVIFPHYGKLFSTLWKKRAIFSTLWKNFEGFFHAMENISASFPHYGKLNEKAGFTGFSGCFPGAVERSTRRPM